MAEVAKFIGYAAAGVDPDFQRGDFLYDQETPFPPMTASPIVTEWPSADQPNTAMYPLRETGPYYAVIVAASAVDTNGGLVINTNAQILNVDDEPVVALYGAGNCVTSPGVNAYYGAGMTLGVAHAFRYAAARHAGRVTREVCLKPSFCADLAGAGSRTLRESCAHAYGQMK